MSEIGTEIRNFYCRSFTGKGCGDAAEFDDENPQDTYHAIQQRLKPLREKRVCAVHLMDSNTSMAQIVVNFCVDSSRQGHNYWR